MNRFVHSLMAASFIIIFLFIGTTANAQSLDPTSVKNGWSDLIVSDIQVYEFALREKEDTGDATSLLSNNPAKRFVSFSPASAKFFTHSQSPGPLKSKGDDVSVSKSGNRIIGNSGGRPVFRLAVEHNGDYSFKLFDTLDHDQQDGKSNPITLNFELLGQNETGRILGGAEIRVEVIDDVPEIETTFCDFWESYLTSSQENGLSGGIGTFEDSEFGFGADGRGHFHLTGELFATRVYTWEKTPITVSNVPVSIQNDGNALTGTIGPTKAFEFSLDRYTGKYKYRQYLDLDHNFEDLEAPLVLNMKLHVHDQDGSYVEQYVLINVYDKGVSKVYYPTNVE